MFGRYENITFWVEVLKLRQTTRARSFWPPNVPWAWALWFKVVLCEFFVHFFLLTFFQLIVYSSKAFEWQSLWLSQFVPCGDVCNGVGLSKGHSGCGGHNGCSGCGGPFATHALVRHNQLMLGCKFTFFLLIFSPLFLSFWKTKLSKVWLSQDCPLVVGFAMVLGSTKVIVVMEVMIQNYLAITLVAYSLIC